MDVTSDAYQDLWEFEASLSDDPRSLTLDWLQFNIDDGFLGFVKAGLALERVRHQKSLYLEHYKDFKEYCEKRLDIGSGYAGQLIKAAKCVMSLIHMGFKRLPNCVSQALKLIKYHDPSEPETMEESTLGQSWLRVLEGCKDRITTSKIEEILEGDDKVKKTLQVKQDTLAKLSKLAHDKGISINELLEGFIDSQNNQDETTDEINNERTDEWEKDLNQLIDEKKENKNKKNDDNNIYFDINIINNI
ncbi:MAG TPA: hypothetical protein VLS94_12545 [Fusibacter sp.]|nr:hypothetical protein [Fusibacter sp.]